MGAALEARAEQQRGGQHVGKTSFAFNSSRWKSSWEPEGPKPTWYVPTTTERPN